MKVGIAFEGNLVNHHIGQSKYLLGPHFGPVEMNLFPEAERAIELAKPIWSKKAEFPVIALDNTGHGLDRGLVLLAGDCDYVGYDNFNGVVRSELGVRISAGGISEDKENKFIDYMQSGRLHISAFANRQFFPKEWEYLPISRDDMHRPKDNRKDLMCTERVNYSLRWIDGKFDDWSDKEVWIRNLTNESYEKTTFHEQRTIWAYSSASIPPVNGRTLTAEEIENIKQIHGRKEMVLPLAPKIDFYEGIYNCRVSRKVDDLERLYHRGVDGYVPLVSHDEISSQFSFSDFKDPSKLSMDEGVDYLFNVVVPAFQAFVDRKE